MPSFATASSRRMYSGVTASACLVGMLGTAAGSTPCVPRTRSATGSAPSTCRSRGATPAAATSFAEVDRDEGQRDEDHAGRPWHDALLQNHLGDPLVGVALRMV